MAIFKDSGENSDVFENRDEILNSAGIQEYARQFSEERAIGYMEAMRDFNRELKFILGAGYTHNGPPKAGMKMRSRIAELFHANDDLIDIFVSKHSNVEKPNP